MKKSDLTAALLTGLMSTSAMAAPPAWMITDADSRIFLFPTVHLLQDGLDWKSNALLSEIERSDEVWTELGKTNTPEMATDIQALVTQRGLSPDVSLSQRLTQEQLAQLTALTTELGLPDGALEPLQPWMAALTLTQVILAKDGLNGENGVEAELDKVFSDRPVRNFETPRMQIEMLASLSMDRQVEFLMQAVNGADQMASDMRQVTEAWADGNPDIIEETLLSEMRRDYPDVFAIMFVNRNENWVDLIKSEMEGSGSDFIAVGAGHLIGEDSVPDLLREQGYSVERISLRD